MDQVSKIKKLANFGLDKMEAHPSHFFDWRIRRAIYREFGEIDRVLKTKRFFNLIVDSAESVLPIFNRAFPEDRLPNELIKTAHQLVTGKISQSDSTVLELV